MGKFIDFEAIKAEVSMVDVITMLDLDLRLRRDQWRGECPVHAGKRGLVITPDHGDYGAFNCNIAKKGGWDSIGLVAHVMECSQYEAAQALQEHQGTGTGTSKSTSTSKGTVPKAEEAKETKKLQPLAHLIYDHEAVQALGLDEEIAEELGVGYAKKGMMRGRVAIPLYRDGELAGYIGYSPKDQTFKLPNNLAAEVPSDEEDDKTVVEFPQRA